MNLNLLAWLSPMLSVALFFIIEQRYAKKSVFIKHRTKTILSIELINIFTGLVLSLVLLLPLVFLIAPLQIFSFSNWQVPKAVSFIASILFLDLINYWGHRLHHKIPLLWRLHRLHHSDRHVNALTTFLHHPFELISNFLIVISLSVIFDIPVIAIVTYGLLSGAHAAFTHFNFVLSPKTERYFRYFLVTPNSHRLHHSLDMKESNSNFGMIFIFWDLFFNTLLLKDHTLIAKLEFGVDNTQTPASISPWMYLKNPFK